MNRQETLLAARMYFGPICGLPAVPAVADNVARGRGIKSLLFT